MRGKERARRTGGGVKVLDGLLAFLLLSLVVGLWVLLWLPPGS